MEPSKQRPKRPCRICKKWFSPDPRLGDRQKTCGDKECQRSWHARQCARWNQKNRAYFQEVYLRRRLLEAEAASPSRSLPPPLKPPPQPASPLNYPRDLVQEVIGAQQLVIVEYIVRLLRRGVQAAIRTQPVETQAEFLGLPTHGISRADGQRGSPQGTVSP
jgi:hypothetical protein